VDTDLDIALKTYSVGIFFAGFIISALMTVYVVKELRKA
jgi:hypothetical protein